MEKTYAMQNTNQKKDEVALLIPKQTSRNTAKEEDGHYIMNKGSVHREHLTVTNVNAPNTTERTKGDIDKFTVKNT